MKPFLALAVMNTVSTGIAIAGTINFDDLKTGASPPGWTAIKTKGQAKWEIVDDDNDKK